MLLRQLSVYVFLFSFLILFSCTAHKNESARDTLFQEMPSDSTGIHFINKVVDTKEMNIFNYHNFYNGAGVAIGDVNNDGKPDVFFTSNQGENKLYINKGNWKFEDVTSLAGLKSTHHWHTGVTMADVNGDGWLDIYVCNAGIIDGDDRANELYINQKNGTFKEEAHAYGLDDKGESTQALFFDYDHDGDLDCFVLNNSHRSIESFGYDKNLRNERDEKNGDRLYRNDGGKFTDVSAQAGIYGSEIGFGLGVTAGDVNNDGWEDLYISNDFFEKDYLYINQHNGTFKEVINDAMGHISNGSMGSDMADINNDGYLDIFTTEMLPESDYRLKTTIKFDNYDVQSARNQLDFHHQFTSNCLQLNNQDGTFSEIAQLAGIDATGWSWGALSFDFDNDGWKDIYVCNGISRDLTDQDFLEYYTNPEVIHQLMQNGFNNLDLIQKMPALPIKNYAFVNQKDLTFKNLADSLGFGTPTFSNGAAYADLDGDGDVDLVINNENGEAFVYRNMTSEKLHRHYLKVRLNGTAPNTFGFGARATIFSNGNRQDLEEMPSRGFESSVDPVLSFGLGDLQRIDSLFVQWPDGRFQKLTGLNVDTTIVLDQRQSIPGRPLQIKPIRPMCKNVTAYTISGNIQHHENEFIDFDVERLIPKMLSTEGPKLAVGDINGDGLEDFYMGSSMDDTAKIFIQRKDGHFVEKPQKAFITDKKFENIGAAFFDADGDGDLDLVVASGGNQAREGSPILAVRLYLNDSKGNFTKAVNGWPSVALNASCVRVLDYNGDGKPDVFIGARSIPGNYGLTPSSILLRNEGNGKFENVTKTEAPDLIQLGMVTDAQWGDIDGDGKKELVVAGDWMPVTIMKYENGKFQKAAELPHSSGWWNCLTLADINGDGKPDLIAGNFGLNSRIKASQQEPAKLYVEDFDKNGKTECIPVYYKTDGKAYPFPLMKDMEMQIPSLKKKFLHFTEYAGKTMEEIFSPEELKEAKVLSVEQAQTCIFINDGKGHFTMKELPVMAQLSPVYGAVATDLNNDGIKDIFLAGNFYGLEPQSGRFDASYGTTLLGDANHQFHYINPSASGLFVRGEARDIAEIKTAMGGHILVVSINNNKLQLFQRNN